MAKYITPLPPDGIVKLPDDVLKAPDPDRHDRVAFTVENGAITLTPERPTLESIAGSVKPRPGMSDDTEEVIRQAKEDYFAEKYREFRQG